MTNFYFLSYKEWLNLVMIFRSYDFSFLSNERPRLTTRAQVFQNQKYSNCRHCSLLSAFLFRVTSAFTSAFLFRVGYMLVVIASTYIRISLCYLHFSFVLVDICTSLSCRWTSALIFRVGGHLHFSFVLATSALIFRVGVDCKYLHPHFSFVLHLHLSFVLATSAFLFVQKLTSAVGQVPESCCIRGAAR